MPFIKSEKNEEKRVWVFHFECRCGKVKMRVESKDSYFPHPVMVQFDHKTNEKCENCKK